MSTVALIPSHISLATLQVSLPGIYLINGKDTGIRVLYEAEDKSDEQQRQNLHHTIAPLLVKKR
ncbi:hypothetical protein C7212DRAFT_305888 [Tuber magnatum]|uniref:Uncharacterized protein n=1 Tax=Tuber magnatum TaxID=42249 RepID=A0A317T3Y7_9PEZI|nr:hypothetical protein C7212DRAFT_305888 [Tuber magnatum]